MSFYLGMLLRYFYELIYNFDLLAIISISICTPRGREATPIVVRAGYGAENCCAYTSFIAAKLSILVKNTFTFSTSSEPKPAASNTLKRFLKHCFVCLTISPSASFPVCESIGVYPDKNSKSPVSTACEYGPTATAALKAFLDIQNSSFNYKIFM